MSELRQGAPRVVITRSTSQAAELAARLSAGGAQCVHVPTVAFESLDASQAISRSASTLGAGDAVAFTSANGVRFSHEALRETLARGVLLAATGSRTSDACDRWLGRPAECVPDRFVAEDFASALIRSVGAGGRVLLPRAEVARDTLPDALDRAGIRVEVVPVYRTVLAPEAPGALAAVAEADVLTFASSLTARLFDQLLVAAGCEGFRQTPTITIGPITSDDARRLGYNVVAEAVEATAESLARTVLSWWRDSYNA